MLVKSLVTGTILTLLAGGVVYYGTDVDATTSFKSGAKKLEKMKLEKMVTDKSALSKTAEEVSKTRHPHGNKTVISSESSSDIPSLKTDNGNLIDPKAVSVTSETNIDPSLEKSARVTDTAKDVIEHAADNHESASTEAPTRKWINQYLKSKPETSHESSAEREPEIVPETEIETVIKEMDIEAREMAEMTEMETEIAEILALEEEIDKEMTAIMIDMEDTDRLETRKTEAFVDRAKNIENIWDNKSEAKEEQAKTAPHTLDKILKKHHTSLETDALSEKPIEEGMEATAETESIDLGNSKMIILKAENVAGHTNKEHTALDEDTKKIRLKVRKNEATINCDEKSLADPIYKSQKMNKPHGHTAHATSEHKKMHRMKKMHQRKCEDAQHMGSKVEASETVKIIMAQAEKISMSELRDRAYLDLVSYALENDDTASANIATSKIEQVELRDTARNRMAVNYAKKGNAEKAFAILEDIEVDALRDVMRLQVIEALITPEAQNSKAMQ